MVATAANVLDVVDAFDVIGIREGRECLGARLRLLSCALRVVAGRLALHGSFVPLGLAVTPGGDLVSVAALPSSESPCVEELIALLQKGLDAGRRARRYAATVLAFESEIPVTGGVAAIRAIELRLCDDSSANTVCFPHLRERGEVRFEWPHWRGEVTSAAGS